MAAMIIGALEARISSLGGELTLEREAHGCAVQDVTAVEGQLTHERNAREVERASHTDLVNDMTRNVEQKLRELNDERATRIRLEGRLEKMNEEITKLVSVAHL